MQTSQRLRGDCGLETLHWLARSQGYRAALAHALTTAQAPGSRPHTKAWQWVIGPDAGLFRACQEAIALDRDELLTQWASALDALIPDRRGSHHFYRTRLHAVLACARAIGCLRRDTEPTGALTALGDALETWAGPPPGARWGTCRGLPHPQHGSSTACTPFKTVRRTVSAICGISGCCS